MVCPYGAVGVASGGGGVNAAKFVSNPGYANPQGGSSEIYYYTARDAFRTEGSKRTDVAVNYDYTIGGASGRKLDLFFQAQMLNVFNTFDLCGCGSTVFSNGGAMALNTIGQSRHGVAGLQPVHDDAGRRNELEQGNELRHAVEPVRVHVAANGPAVFRRQVLAASGSQGFWTSR